MGLMNPMRAQLLIDSQCSLGEGATWCAASGRFWWTDIEGKKLWRYDPRDGASESFDMPERLACFTPCADARFLLLGLASRLAFHEIATGKIETIMEVEADLPTRLNDGRCDREGRFVFGTKHDVDDAQPVGAFYRLNADLSLEKLPLGNCAISNSIGFSPDGATMYYCDSPTRQIRVCDYPTFDNDRVFVELTDATGVPDGSIVDADGGLWNAQWGGARVVRYESDGRETARIDVPSAQPSCAAFGGADFGTLYVTTARIGLGETDAHAGGVFVATPGARGIAEAVFAGKA
ncbi:MULTISPECIES: SMP-30/gluconolactonase/LRE family protein [unclassified Caballeronia]|jgi:L-arabinonolactonase|uniref:SMP-30/gluconolactonase/LRE family protein n=1 Tax=unclassified Caballeronia TaxID=2646786 RepID=UPI002028939B|nr:MULTISPECIES: SMP-30/gluconolactonase/LRE family protein [unclassified Caballeronia]MDR5786468.1 SMP-30/gluconolactonase/LRE family protein [Caballeronia sp. LP003]